MMRVIYPDADIANADWPKRTNDVLPIDIKALRGLYSPDQPRVPAGGPGGGEWEGGGGASSDTKARSERAASTHKPSTKEKQRWAEANEKRLVGMIGGEQTGDNKPADVVLRDRGIFHGIEVKTLLDNKNNKITMHTASRERKEKWAKKNGATIHTLCFDDRDKFGSPNYSGNRMYYRRGVGSFRIAKMTPVRDADHLRSLMRGKK